MSSPGGAPDGLPQVTPLEALLEKFAEGAFGSTKEALESFKEAEKHRREIELRQLTEDHKASAVRRSTHAKLYLFCMTGALVAVTAFAAIALGLTKGSNTERTQAITAAGSIVSGMLGFLVGKNID